MRSSIRPCPSLAAVGAALLFFCSASLASRTARADEPTTLPAPAPSALAGPSAPVVPVAPSAAPTVLLHLAGPRGTRLQRRTGPAGWSNECEAPCDVRVPASGEYRLFLAEAPETRPFLLAPGDALTLYPQPASEGLLLLGGMLAYGSLSLAPVPLTLLIVGGAKGSSDLVIAGVISTVVVFGAGGIGAALMASNARSDVTQAQGGPPQPLPVPVREDARASAMPPPPFYAVPLLSGRF
jgi:hypothetical protein